MIGLTPEDLKVMLGKPLSGGASARFNADTALRYKDDAFTYEIGMIAKVSVYAVVAKVTNQRLQDLEVLGLLYSAARRGQWEQLTQPPDKKKPLGTTVSLDYRYLEMADKTTVARVLLARLQPRRMQLVIYSPDWRPDLPALAKQG